MISNKKIVLLCILEYVLLLGYHIAYSILYCTKDQTYKVTVWSLCVLTILILFSQAFRKQLDLIVYVTMVGVVLSVSYVGFVLGTLAYGVVIFFCAGLTLSLFLNTKYTIIWGILSFAVLVSYTFLGKDIITNLVPTVFLYYGYIFTYTIGIIFLLILVSATSQQFDSISKEKQLTEKESDMKNVFWANVSTELRTPMNVINGMSRLLKMENLNVRAKEYTDQIENASGMLLSIVNDTMELSHIETGVYAVREKGYDIYRLAHMAIMDSAVNIHSDGVNLAYCVSPKVPVALVGDEEMLLKIMTRLLNNALIFTENGEVRLDIDVAKEDKKNVELKIRIKDNGIGIPEEDLPNIFRGFDSNDVNRSTEQETVGLSLKLCKSMVELLGGSISVESTLGEGSAFIIILPQKIGTDDDLKKKDEDDGYSVKSSWKSYDASVLVVDDTPTNLKLISGMVSLYGINTETAESGKEALKKMEQKKYDMVLLDYMMPEMNGADVLKQIKNRGVMENFGNVPIVALTSKSLQRDRAKFLSLGFDDFISKPVDDRELENILRRFL